jgi:predicted dehydrogenase
LGIGIVGSGFNARFHIQAFQAVRDAEIRGIYSPTRARAAATAAFARSLDVGDAQVYASISEMVADPAIDAIWLNAPNHSRIENVAEIVHVLERGRGALRGVACEKPLGRNLAEANELLQLVQRVELPHGYLENQVFAPHLARGKQLLWARGAATTGRPYLARAAEEHSGPHMPWFWQGRLQGGGVLNDMMCHSALVIRHLLTEPGAARTSLRPRKVTGHIASLKWTRPDYARKLTDMMGAAVDYSKTPAEDFASVMVEFESEDGLRVLGEATTSWSYVGAGLRLSAELLGPEYSMRWNSLDSGLQLFFSREVRGAQGEDLVEKQNAEIGVMPVVPDEAAAYGYEAEDRHFVRVFLGKEKPLLDFHDGIEVVRVLMAAYKSAEAARTVDIETEPLEDFVPMVAQGTWQP